MQASGRHVLHIQIDQMDTTGGLLGRDQLFDKKFVANTFSQNRYSHFDLF